MMIPWWVVIIGVAGGAFFGVFVAAMCAAADNAEDHRPEPGEGKRKT